ncbi:hypothetical protein PMAYCL1PPCAC_32007 [Pristionchus mayeri]|uniref:G protein-coupled receptor n=1 Tax=Pristionchus mayeri TaxID=1317129 RepID=A0AAN5ID15_9BILA|nr:hypothetical protein PMAYCL1PPCAC_32007 [Pristionchus mayeri]
MSTPSYYVSAAEGVCRHWGSPSLCFVLNSVQLAGAAHYAVMIAFCSCYRYYVIAGSHHGEPSKRSVLLALFAIHLPTIIIYYNFALCPLLEGAELERAMNESHPEYAMKTHDEMLLVTRHGFSVQLALYWLEGLIVPVVTVVAIAAVRTNRILASVDHISTSSKIRHEQILKGILWQATLPGLYAIGLIMYVVTKRKVIGTDGVGHLTIMIGSLITLLSPIFTLYFTLPYRHELNGCVNSITRQSHLHKRLQDRNNARHLSDVSSLIMPNGAPVNL